MEEQLQNNFADIYQFTIILIFSITLMKAERK